MKRWKLYVKRKKLWLSFAKEKEVNQNVKTSGAKAVNTTKKCSGKAIGSGAALVNKILRGKVYDLL